MAQQSVFYAGTALPDVAVPPQPTLTPDVKIVIDRDNNGQIAVGNNILQVGSNYGNVYYLNVQGGQAVITPRPRPVDRRPRAFENLIGRKNEIRTVRGGLRTLKLAEITAIEGMGKTSLLRSIAHLPYPLPDGVLYLSVANKRLGDLQQEIFDAFYESPVPVMPDANQLSQRLHDIRALIILDDIELPYTELEKLYTIMPNSAFLLATAETRLLGEGWSLALNGLLPDEGAELFRRKLGRGLTPEEATAVRHFSKRLNGHPLSILRAAALARNQTAQLLTTFLAVLSALPNPPAAVLSQRLVRQSDIKERQVIAILAALNGASLRTAQLTTLLRQDATELLLEMNNKGLVESEPDGRVRLGAGVAAVVAGTDLTPWREILVQHFLNWAALNHSNPLRILDEAEAIQVLIDWAERSDRPDLVIRLVRALEGSLALGKQWEAWENVLQKALAAARVAKKPADEAWALHQLGTHAFGTNNRTEARRTWTRALQLRRALGDRIGEELTRYHLDLLRFLPPQQERDQKEQPPSQEGSSSLPQPTPIAGLSTVSVLTIAIGILVILMVGLSAFIMTPDTGGSSLLTPMIPPTPPITVTIVGVEEEVDSPTPSAEPSATDTATAVTPTPSPTIVPTSTPLPPSPIIIVVTSPPRVVTNTPWPTWTPSPTASHTPSPTEPITPSPTVTPSATVTLTSTMTLTPTVHNANPPEVQITEPRSYDQYAAKELITFSGVAQDAEDGDLSDRIIWASDVNGEIGYGASFEVYANSLTPGIHIISAAVSDSGGLPAVSRVVISVAGNTPPTIDIIAPQDGGSYNDNQLDFAAIATDAEDGEVTDSLLWTSSIDGKVAIGGQSVVSLSLGVHTITVTATDSQGVSSEITITITITNF